MGSIKIIEKPEYVSFDDIHDILYKAHQANRDNGFTVPTAILSGGELKEHLGENGKCFVAMDGDKLVGTTSNRIQSVHHWCMKGDVVELALVGVLPEYKGRRIYSQLFNEALKDVEQRGFKHLELRTADKNRTMQKLNQRNGFQYIDFFAAGKVDHYTVVMLKWLDGCPYPDWVIRLRYFLKKMYTKMRFKPGRVKRFGI